MPSLATNIHKKTIFSFSIVLFIFNPSDLHLFTDATAITLTCISLFGYN